MKRGERARLEWFCDFNIVTKERFGKVNFEKICRKAKEIAMWMTEKRIIKTE